MSAAAPAIPTPPKRSLQENLELAIRSKAFLPGVLVTGGIIFAFWSLIQGLPDLWFGIDGYYSHGVLVPLISAYIVFKWWPKLREIPVRPGWIALVPLLALVVLVRAAVLTDIQQLVSVGLIAALLMGVWLVAGWRWMLALAFPILYLAFALPLWTAAIDNYTNPLQIVSTEVSYAMLKATGFEPMRFTPTVIHLNNFVLDIGVPCSGLKLLLAVTAFTVFFMMIGNLRWWGNLTMATMVLPLCLFINGLRIALIGVVGEIWGDEAGFRFHDYSGYITLIICFIILFKIARWLGWKD
jgi:exosortase